MLTKLLAKLAAAMILAPAPQSSWTMPQHVPVVSAVGGMAVVHATNCSQAGGTGNATFSCTIPATTAGNALLWACAVDDAYTFTSTSPASTALITQADGGGGTSTNLSLWLTPNISGGVTSVSLTYSNGYAELDCTVVEVSGFPTTITTDQATAVAQTAYGGSGSTGSVTTTHASDTILGVVGLNGNATAPTFGAGTGYSVAGIGLVTGGTHWGVMLEYQNVAATGTYNPGVSFTPNPSYAAVATVALER